MCILLGIAILKQTAHHSNGGNDGNRGKEGRVGIRGIRGNKDIEGNVSNYGVPFVSILHNYERLIYSPNICKYKQTFNKPQHEFINVYSYIQTSGRFVNIHRYL